MRRAYLTIDDSPTRHTDDLTDWLLARNIPAVLFCIGSSYKDMHLQCDGMEQNPDPIVRAIERGFVIGNHTWSHRRASEHSYEEIVQEIEKTEGMIDRLYAQADVSRPVKLIRFPHLDRGAGGWVVDYEAAGPYQEILKELFCSGLNIKMIPPPSELTDKKMRVQEYLKREGFTAAVYPGVSFDWYEHTEMASACDSLYTFSTADWMMNPDFSAYNKDWAYHSLDELKAKIDQDKWLKSEDSAHIVLAHDHNNMFEVTTSLIDHMMSQGIQFQEIKV